MQKYSKKNPYDRNFERKTYNVFGSKREIAWKIKLQRIISESYVFQQVTTPSSSLNQGAVIVLYTEVLGNTSNHLYSKSLCTVYKFCFIFQRSIFWCIWCIDCFIVCVGSGVLVIIFLYFNYNISKSTYSMIWQYLDY